jgi:hypothetical protein
MKLKLKQWAQIAEVIGALAIVVSLIYVANEVRHNTAATQAATFQQMVQQSASSLIAIAADAELADLQRRGIRDAKSLTEQEEFRLFLITRAQWRGMEGAFFQKQHGVLGDAEWESYRNTMCQELISILGWEEHRSALSPEFVAFIEGCRQ